MWSKKTLAKIAILILIIAVGAAFGWYSKTWLNPSIMVQPPLIRENSSEYHFINPLILVGGGKENPGYADLKNNINSYITNATQNNSADSISFYFQDLNSGNWTGVNPDLLYDPSSMMKVAMMLGYLNEATDNPKILTEELKYTHTPDQGQHYPPEHVLENGSYPARELIESMIIDSDNDALASLYNNDREAFVNVFKELNIPPPASITTTDFMSPKIYSRIFRTLYNSTFLSRPVSEQALQLLSYTNFKNGLVAGVPENTVVSHKFGEHTTLDAIGNVVSVELHDCGIVYLAKKPYFICVMTKGSDFSKLESVISDISKMVYDYSNK